MAEKRLFHQRHPLISAIFIMGVVFFMFWGGMTFFLTALSQQASEKQLFSAGSDGVGVMEIKGIILAAEEPLKTLRRFAENSTVKAVVVRIDSPGGAVGASQEIFSEIRNLSQLKPVVASFGSVAASGGYYAALGAEKIMASPGTLTGSMGVIMKFANLQQVFDKIGYKNEVIKSGEFKDMGSASREITAAERKLLQGLIDTVHSQFVDDIAETRGLPVAEVKKVADGRIFSGSQAKELGLIDELGNFNDAVQLAAEMGGLDPDTMPRLIYPPRMDDGFLGLLLNETKSGLAGVLPGQGPVLAYEWNGSLTGQP
ncbi:MAG: signal peptide peptidase SppA [Thermodesulfobacteriota bacterium]